MWLFFSRAFSSSATQEMTPGTTFKLHFQLDICRLCVSRPCIKHGAGVARKFRGTICRRADINYFNIYIARWIFYFTYTQHNRVQQPLPSPFNCGPLSSHLDHRLSARVLLCCICFFYGNNCGDATWLVRYGDQEKLLLICHRRRHYNNYFCCGCCTLWICASGVICHHPFCVSPED